MSATKRKVMACLDLRPEYASLLTTDDRATNIQAVPLWMCSQKVNPSTGRLRSSCYYNVEKCLSLCQLYV